MTIRSRSANAARQHSDRARAERRGMAHRFAARGMGWHRIVVRRHSDAGNTLGALGAGGKMWRREPFAPLMVQTRRIAPC